MLLIREATQQDAAALAHVHIESWRAAYAGIVPQAALDALNEPARARDWVEWLNFPNPVFVAILDSVLIGFAAGGPIREPLPPHDAELYVLYLLPSAQRRGIGTALFRTVARSLHARGFQSLIAWVLAANASTAFYTAAGASVVASKDVDIAGRLLPTEAYAWRTFATLALQ